MSFELVETSDGSWSCLDATTGELCHNRAGAYTEALKNYTEASGAIEHIRKTGRLRVLDACYGMGYNTWVLINEVLKQVDPPGAIHVTAIELSTEVIGFLPRILDHPTFDILKSKIPAIEHNIYYRTHRCLTDTKVGGGFSISVAEPSAIQIDFHVDDLRKVLPSLENDYDLVFHDPFSPNKMPELWTIDIFREYARLLKKPDGKVLTYSAAASVRGGMREAGFRIAKTEALGSKSGGTLASFNDGLGLPLNPDELEYLETKAGIPFRDRWLKSSRDEILQRRAEEQYQSPRKSGNAVRNALGKRSPK